MAYAEKFISEIRDSLINTYNVAILNFIIYMKCLLFTHEEPSKEIVGNFNEIVNVITEMLWARRNRICENSKA